MYARQRNHFAAPQGSDCLSPDAAQTRPVIDTVSTTVNTMDIGAIRHMAARERSIEAKRLFGAFAHWFGDLAISRRRWSV
jgi:hypothetical protein